MKQNPLMKLMYCPFQAYNHLIEYLKLIILSDSKKREKTKISKKV